MLLQDITSEGEMRKQKSCVAFLHLRLYHLAFLATYSLLRGLKRNDTDSTGAFSGSRSDPLGNKELFFYSFTLFFYPLSLCQIPPVTDTLLLLLFSSPSPCFKLLFYLYFLLYIFIISRSTQTMQTLPRAIRLEIVFFP